MYWLIPREYAPRDGEFTYPDKLSEYFIFIGTFFITDIVWRPVYQMRVISYPLDIFTYDTRWISSNNRVRLVKFFRHHGASCNNTFRWYLHTLGKVALLTYPHMITNRHTI